MNLRGHEMISRVGNKEKLNSATNDYVGFFFFTFLYSWNSYLVSYIFRTLKIIQIKPPFNRSAHNATYTVHQRVVNLVS